MHHFRIALLFTVALYSSLRASSDPCAPLPLSTNPSCSNLDAHHPKLLMNASKRDELKCRVVSGLAQDRFFKKVWDESVVMRVKAILEQPLPSLHAAIPEEDPNYNKNLSQMGDDLSHLAFTLSVMPEQIPFDEESPWFVTKKEVRLGLFKLIDAFLYNYDAKNLPLGIAPMNVDLPAGHVLFGFAMVYDWLYYDDDSGWAKRRSKIRDLLLKYGSRVYRAVTVPSPHTGWFPTATSKHFLQNHLWIVETSLAAASYALGDTCDPLVSPEMRARLKTWDKAVLNDMLVAQTKLNTDGYGHEGPWYWGYGMQSLIKYREMNLATNHTDVFLNQTTEKLLHYWEKTPFFRIFLSLPKAAVTDINQVVDIGDMSTRADSYAAAVMRYLAKINKNGVAQGMITDLDSVLTYREPWLSLLWQDRTLVPLSLNSLPTFRHFPVMGVASSRSDWSGNESMVIFKSGPPMGHESIANNPNDGGAAAIRYYLPSSGHVHPDAGSFSLFGAGRWLIRNVGYTKKSSDYENTLTVNGVGQVGEGGKWFDGVGAVKARSTLAVKSDPNGFGDFDYLVGDASAAYPPSARLTRYQRHLIYLKRLDVLLLVNDIEVRNAANLQLNFHTELPSTLLKDKLVSLDPKTDSALELRWFNSAPPSVTVRHDVVYLQAASDYDTTPPLVRFEKRSTKSWATAQALTWSTSSDQVASVSSIFDEENQIWRFTVTPKTGKQLAVKLKPRLQELSIQ